jgi:peptidoglycan/LPS O-acetylase OafA/YrhL
VGGRVPALDGLRGVAILLVLGYHSDLLPGGHLGVSVFFVLSGYLITTLLLAERQRTGRIDRRAFYLRRAARLGPALVVVLAVHTFLFSGDGIEAVVFGVLPALLYGMSLTRPLWQPVLGTGWAWSLSIEEQFYAVWPWLLRRPARLASACAALIVVVTLARAFAVWLLGWEWAYFSTFTRADGLLLGALVALVPPNLPAWSSWAGGGLLACSAVLGTAHGPWTLVLGVPAAQLGTAALIVTLPTWLTGRFLRRAGTLSYGLYLWSALVYNVLVRLDADRRGLWLLVVSWPLAEASWRWLELPVQRTVRRRSSVDGRMRAKRRVTRTRHSPRNSQLHG